MQPIWTIVRPLAIALTLLVASSGCESDNELPPVTQKGARTLGFKYDGETYEGSLVQGVFYQDALQINASKKNDNKGNARITVENYRGEDTLILDNHTSGDTIDLRMFSVTLNRNNHEPGGVYQTDSCCSIELIITKFNTEEGVVSGTFRGKVLHLDKQDTLQITKGRFDATM